MLVLAGGPKLRKWYGAPDLFHKEGGSEEDDEDDESDGEQYIFKKKIYIIFYKSDAYDHLFRVQME